MEQVSALPTPKRVTVEDVKRKLRIKSAAVEEFMVSPIGKQVMEALEEEFYHSQIFDPDPYVSAFQLGQRDVVRYLYSLKNYPSEDISNATGTT